jgi:glycosyltransferase involved in cell wall biosynthesis
MLGAPQRIGRSVMTMRTMAATSMTAAAVAASERGVMRVLYCSAVAPQPTGAGELLVHRHLTALTEWHLMIVAGEDRPASPDVVADLTTVPRVPRWIQRCRRGPAFASAERVAARWLVARFERQADRFRPSIVVSTMLPDPLMSAAARFAARRGIPLVLFCHDDYAPALSSSARRFLRDVYRQAAVRLCVSRAMEEEFAHRYGVRGEVLPPIPAAPAAAVRPAHDGEPLIVGFAGAIGQGYTGAFVALADALAREGGRLVVASPTPRDGYSRIFSHPAVTDLGALRVADVRATMLAAGVNTLAVVQSFALDDERSYRFNFPSKLTEYSTYGLPVLVVAPPTASAATWMCDNSGSGILVHALDGDALSEAVRRLAFANERVALAAGFRSAASAFDPALLQRRFERALLQSAGAPASDDVSCEFS